MTSRALSALSTLFCPATALIGRLRYVQKFAVVGLVLLVPLLLVAGVYVESQKDDIDFARQEQDGLQYLKPLTGFLSDVVLARHVAVTSGTDDVAYLETGMARVDAVNRRLGRELKVDSAWSRARKLVLDAANSRSLPTEQRFEAYNRATEALLEVFSEAGDNSGLSRDPDVDSFYLADILRVRMPMLCDNAVRSTDRMALGQNAVGDEAITKVLIALSQEYGAVLSNRALIAGGVKKVVEYTAQPSLEHPLRQRYAQLDELTVGMGNRLQEAVETRSFAAYPEFASNELQTAVKLFARVVLDSLDALLKVRIDNLTKRSYQIELATGLAVLLALYLFVGFYRSVSAPIHRIVETLRAVAGGDLSRRVVVKTHDELSFVAAVLNDTVAKTETATRRLAVQATRDSLTSLPNRAVAIDRLDHALERFRRVGSLMAVIFIDLDRFKLINDSLGHDAGDDVLRAVADRLFSTMRASDTVARLAGDEFVLISENLQGPEEAIKIAERVVETLNEPIKILVEGHERDVTIGASVGIAFASEQPDLSSGNLLRDADVAMYRAKQRGRGRVEVFDDSLRSAIERRLETQHGLRRAIDTGQLRVFYQPIVDTVTEQTFGFEALVRWQHPTRGLLAPGDFIEIAEESGLIVSIGAHVLAVACQQAATWRAERPADERFHISVNVSAAQFNHPAFVATVATVLEETGLDPDALWLEITETSMLADVKAAANTMDKIRLLGAHFSVDDFGTGYTSLTYLRQFPVEVLKVDRSFVSGLGGNWEDEAIVKMLISLANTLHLLVVAEGVETREQYEKLRELGAGACQGYLFGRPSPPELAWNASDLEDMAQAAAGVTDEPQA